MKVFIDGCARELPVGDGTMANFARRQSDGELVRPAKVFKEICWHETVRGNLPDVFGCRYPDAGTMLPLPEGFVSVTADGQSDSAKYG